MLTREGTPAAEGAAQKGFSLHTVSVTIPDLVPALGADLGKSSPIGGSVIPVREAQALETDRAIATFKDTRRPLAKALVLV